MADNENLNVQEGAIDDDIVVEEVTPPTTEEEIPEIDPKDAELATAAEQIAALSDKLMRNAAEFDNFKKRTAREKEDFYKMAVCETVLPFLSVLDNLERALAAAETAKDAESVLSGVQMIKKQFDDTLTAVGVAPIEAVGCEFDPEKHNAVMTAESDEKENTVLEEFQKGYIYKDKVIRHSMVKVSN